MYEILSWENNKVNAESKVQKYIENDIDKNDLYQIGNMSLDDKR